MDPLGFIRYLQTFCEIRALEVLADQLPPPAQMDPETCYLGFEMQLRTASGQEAIQSAFEFRTRRLHAGDYLDCAVAEPTLAAAAQKDTADEPATKQATASGESSAATAFIRIDAAKLDELITRVGELIIAAAGANLLARRSGNSELTESTSTLSSLVEEVREGALQLRMVKIGATFNRFQRTVRDVSRELGKEIQLVVHGEDTELDKTVVERIADPLTHLVRNAMDHGIEPADVRLARGKPALGTVTLNAYHDSGSVVIEVGDDGGGLKRDKILAKAIQRGLVEEGCSLTDSEVFAFIFEAGFSTAEKVTNLSGRGVGMDVVKRNITALRGIVSIDSEEGRGTTVTVRLPLTLAIINGFQVAVGKSSFVLPLDSIEECVEFSILRASTTSPTCGGIGAALHPAARRVRYARAAFAPPEYCGRETRRRADRTGGRCAARRISNSDQAAREVVPQGRLCQRIEHSRQRGSRSDPRRAGAHTTGSSARRE